MIDFGFSGPVATEPDALAVCRQETGLDFGPLDLDTERARWTRMGFSDTTLEYVSRLHTWAVTPSDGDTLDHRLDAILRYLSCVYRNTPLHSAVEAAHERVYARLHPRQPVAVDFGF